ncbi:MAG: hypothetical protein CBE20_04225 [Gammaproteobacteria bacterium TMED260]|nr:hypothetical protein [Gammaproteobacteria bacterium]OUX33641.1 MAG: hypothetical protein CBE20_04225 [Gammaproteobacteria bacterium TMED260]
MRFSPATDYSLFRVRCLEFVVSTLGGPKNAHILRIREGSERWMHCPLNLVEMLEFQGEIARFRLPG